MFPEPNRDNPSYPAPPPAHPCSDSSLSGLTDNRLTEAGESPPLPALAARPISLSDLTPEQRSRMLRNLEALVAVIEEFGEDLNCSVIQPLRQSLSHGISSRQSFEFLVLNSRDLLLDRALGFESKINDFTRLNEVISEYAQVIRTGISDVVQTFNILLQEGEKPHAEKALHDIANQLFRIGSSDAHALTPVLRQKIRELTLKDSAA